MRPGTQCLYLGKSKSSAGITVAGASTPSLAGVPIPAGLTQRDLQNPKVKDLENRVREMEAKLKASNFSSSNVSQDPIVRCDNGGPVCISTGCGKVGGKLAQLEAGGACPVRECPLRAKVVTRARHRPKTPPNDRYRLSNGGSEEERRLIDRFFAGSWATPLMVVHAPTFLGAVDDQLPMLRYAVCCMGALYNHDPEDEKIADWYYEKAKSLVSKCLEDPTLDVLQGLVVLMNCAAEKGKMSSAWMLMGMAARIMMYLRADDDPDDLDPDEVAKMTWVDKEARRRCWWITYIQDRCDHLKVAPVKNPCSNAIWDMTDIELAAQLYNAPTLSSTQNPFSFFARLVELFAQSTEVYNAQCAVDINVTLPSAVAESLLSVQALLDDYIAGLPEPVQLLFSSSVPFVSPLGRPDASSFLVYMYHACNCNINRPQAMRLTHMSRVELSTLPVEELRRLERAVEIGRTSAEIMARKNELSIRSAADVGRQPQFATGPLFECSLFLVLLASRSSPFGSRPDPAYNFALRRWFAMNLKTLKLLARTWKVAAYMVISLEALLHCVPGIELPAHLLANDVYENAVYGIGVMDDASTTMLSPPPEVAPVEMVAKPGSPDPVSAALAMLAQKAPGTHDRIVAELWLERAHGVCLAVGGAPILPTALAGSSGLDAADMITGMSVNVPVTDSTWSEGVGVGIGSAVEDDNPGFFTGEMIEGESTEQFIERLIATAGSWDGSRI
ncbi:hypothetical protein HK101_010639 [Irineochytrium annulatum]|nr:hypothetical protein HK101_010639 [Irineochytrium annulatum]